MKPSRYCSSTSTTSPQTPPPPSYSPTSQQRSPPTATTYASSPRVAATADASDRFPRREQLDGVYVRRVGGTGFTQAKRWGRLINYFAFFASASRQLLLTRRPDVVVSLSTPPLLATIVQTVAALRRARFVYWVMDVHPELAFRLGHLKKTSITGRIMEWSGRRTLGKADTVIALGDDMAVHLKPYSNGNTRVARTWADGDRIHPHVAPGHPLREQWGWEGRFVVAYSGTMGLVHEFDTILEAATVLNDDDRYLFCFIGGGARSSEVQDEVERRQLRNIEFRDFVPDEQLPLSLTAPDVHLVSLRDDLAGSQSFHPRRTACSPLGNQLPTSVPSTRTSRRSSRAANAVSTWQTVIRRRSSTHLSATGAVPTPARSTKPPRGGSSKTSSSAVRAFELSRP